MATLEKTVHQERYGSLSDLLDAHYALLSSPTEEVLTPEDRTRIHEFLDKGAATGAVLDNSIDRRQAQGLLDYWVSTLYADSRTLEDTRESSSCLPRPQARLALFDHATVGEAAENADRFIQGFSNDDQEVARKVLLRLTELESKTGMPRPLPTTRSALEACGDPKTSRPVVDGLLEAGVVRHVGGKPGEADEQVALATESLLRVWPQLQQWLEQRIRFRDTVQYWVNQGESGDALIRGELLDEARDYHDLNDQEREFVTRSRNSEISQSQRIKRSRNWFRALFIVALIFGMVSIWQSRRANYSLKKEEAAHALAEERRIAADEARERANEARKKAEVLVDIYQEENQRCAAMREDVDQVVKAGYDVVESYSAELGATKIAEPVLDFMMTLEASGLRTSVTPGLLPSHDTSYDPDFLGRQIDLPRLLPSLSQEVHDGGRPIEYLHYSLIFDANRRAAIYTACNYDRSKKQDVRRGPDRFRYEARVSRDNQLGAALYTHNEFDRGHLVSRLDIMWGSRDSLNIDLLQSAVNIYTNTIPMYEGFNRVLWAAIEDWVRTEHNPEADRISIFTGPVFREDDYEYRGAEIPRSFWKVVVSRRGGNSSDLVTNAFIAAQYDAADPSRPIGQKSVRRCRTSVRVIEQLTGLDFGSVADFETWRPAARRE